MKLWSIKRLKRINTTFKILVNILFTLTFNSMNIRFIFFIIYICNYICYSIIIILRSISMFHTRTDIGPNTVILHGTSRAPVKYSANLHRIYRGVLPVLDASVWKMFCVTFYKSTYYRKENHLLCTQNNAVLRML